MGFEPWEGLSLEAGLLGRLKGGGVLKKAPNHLSEPLLYRCPPPPKPGPLSPAFPGSNSISLPFRLCDVRPIP